MAIRRTAPYLVFLLVVLCFALCVPVGAQDSENPDWDLGVSGLAGVQEEKLPPPPAEKTEYSSAGISSRVFRILKWGDYAPMAETWGFSFKPKQKDQYWLVNLEEIKDGKYMVLLLDGECARGMPQFHPIPGQCVKKERWDSWQKIKILIRKELKKGEYAHLYPQLEKYIAGRK